MADEDRIPLATESPRSNIAEVEDARLKEDMILSFSWTMRATLPVVPS